MTSETPMTQDQNNKPAGDETHQWHFWHGIECCKVCAICRRADRTNKPCPGKMAAIGLRQKEGPQ